MRDDFDPVVADRFKVLDQVPVPDTWSRVLDHVAVSDMSAFKTEEVLNMVDLETVALDRAPPEAADAGPGRRPRGGRRGGRDRPRGEPLRRRRDAIRRTVADRGTVSPAPPAQALFEQPDSGRGRARDVLRR